MVPSDAVAQHWANHSAHWHLELSVFQLSGPTRFGTHHLAHNYRYKQARVHTQIWRDPEQQNSLSLDFRLPGDADHNPSSPGRLTRLPRGSGYRCWLTETHSKPRIWNLFLCSDTLHFICIFTYSEPCVHFLPVRDREKTGHRWSWCVFINFQKGVCHCLLETNRGAVECLAL